MGAQEKTTRSRVTSNYYNENSFYRGSFLKLKDKMNRSGNTFKAIDTFIPTYKNNGKGKASKEHQNPKSVPMF